MHVCMVSTSFSPIFPSREGAINNYVFELSRKLSRWDKISLFGRGNGVFHKGGNFDVQSFNYSLPMAFSKQTQIRDLTYSAIYSGYLLAHVQRKNKKMPMQIFHIHNVYQTPVAKFFQDMYNLKTVCSIHNAFKAPLLLNYCNKILANSTYMKDFLANEVHIDKRKIDVLPIAVDTDLFRPIINAKKLLHLDGKRVILFIGRKIPYKGPQVIVDALPEIRKVFPEAITILIGPDYFFGSQISSYSDFLQERARKLNVQNSVVLRSFITETDLRLYLNAADVLVCPSIWQEPFGKVVIEANACEKPVVVTKVGGLPELVNHGKNGFLVRPNHVKELATAIINLLKNNELANQMGKTGREFVEKKYSYDVVSVKCHKIYENMLND